jgi:hypothetical protein
VEKIEYLRNHELGYFNIYNPDYKCLGQMGNNIAVFVYIPEEREDTYMHFEVIDVNRPYRNNYAQVKRIFELEVELSECNAWIVTMSRIDEQYRGHKMAPRLYKWIMQRMNIVFQAGDEQSPGGRGIWHSLAGMKDVLVYGKTYKTDMIVCEQDEFDNEITVDEEGVLCYGGPHHFTAFACYSPERKK